MITAARPYTVQNRQQRNNFGSIRTAGDTKDAIIFALASRDPAKKITEAQAILRIDEAIKGEDSIGKKILENFKAALTGDKK